MATVRAWARRRRRGRELANIRAGALRGGLDLWAVSDADLIRAVWRIGRPAPEIHDDDLAEWTTRQLARALGLASVEKHG